MEDFVRLLSTDEGDIYHITLSEDTVLFSQDTLKIINDVKVIGIDLRRLVGNSPITQKGWFSLCREIVVNDSWTSQAAEPSA